MIDTRVRPHLQGILGPIGKFLAGLGVTPAAMTGFGLVVTIVGAVLIGMGDLAVGGAIALVGSALDGLDGTVARASGAVTDRGAFLDSASDRIGEIAAFAGLTVIVWPRLEGPLFELYELVPGFVLATAAIVVVSLLESPSAERVVESV